MHDGPPRLHPIRRGRGGSLQQGFGQSGILLDQLVDLSVLRGQARHNKLESRPQTSLPASREEFGAYNRSMWDSETLTVTPEARAIAEQVLASAYRSQPFCIRGASKGSLPIRYRGVGQS